MQVSRRQAMALAGLGTANLLGSPTVAQSRQKVVMGQPSEGFIYLPIYVARTKGFFEEEGLNAEVITFSKGGAEALAAVLGGQSDIYVGSPSVQLRAQEKRQPVQSFRSGSDAVWIGSRAFSRRGEEDRSCEFEGPEGEGSRLEGHDHRGGGSWKPYGSDGPAHRRIRRPESGPGYDHHANRGRKQHAGRIRTETDRWIRVVRADVDHGNSAVRRCHAVRLRPG